jgi:hypothetical protein
MNNKQIICFLYAVAGCSILNSILYIKFFSREQSMAMMLPTNSNGISTTNHHDHRRIVFLPGPHKTSSSSVQFNLCQWLYESEKKNENADLNATNDIKAVVKGGLQKHWTMPIPDEVFKSSNRGCFKIFGTLAQVLTYTNVPTQHNYKYEGKDIIDLYRDEFHKQWNNGRSLVFASEHFDWIANKDRNAGNQLIENLLHILPIENTSSVTAVVVYRAPRLDHLFSLWHQDGLRKKRMSFYDFLMTLVPVEDELRILDSLLLAERLIQRGIHTVLIDLSGVQKHGYDISLVIACDVLDAECDAEKHFVGEENAKPEKKNNRHHSKKMVNVTDAQLDAINKLIESYDCNFQHILKSDKLQVLYPNELERIMNSCSKNAIHQQSDYPKSHDQLLKKIIEILLSNEK